MKTSYSTRPIPQWTAAYTEDEMDKWLEKAGQIESDGVDGVAADHMARFQIEDDREWKNGNT